MATDDVQTDDTTRDDPQAETAADEAGADPTTEQLKAENERLRAEATADARRLKELIELSRNRGREEFARLGLYEKM